MKADSAGTKLPHSSIEPAQPSSAHTAPELLKEGEAGRQSSKNEVWFTRVTKKLIHLRGMVFLLSFAGGVGLAMTLPPWGFYGLAPFASGLLYACTRGLSAKGRILAGWLCGLGLFIPGLAWATSFNTAGGVVLIAFEACFMSLAFLIVPPVRGRPFAFPAALAITEWARQSWPFGGLPIGSIALGQASSPLGQTARLGGPLLIVALVGVAGVFVDAIARASIIAWQDHRSRQMNQTSTLPEEEVHNEKQTMPCSRKNAKGHFLTVAALSAVVVVGLDVVATLAPAGGPPIHRIRVAAVQGGGKRGLHKFQVPVSQVFDAQVIPTEKLIPLSRRQPIQLVLWPEDVISLSTPLVGSPQARIVSDIARAMHTTLVAGVTYPVGTSHFRNEAVAWGPSGRIVAHYEKVHRVPFGEYVPYRSFFKHFANLSLVPLNAIPGHKSGLLRTPAGPLATTISYEVFFADRGRSAVRAGGELLIVPTNTSSYSTGQVPSQEIAASELQAIEEGRNLVQAAPTGYSAFINNRGVLQKRTSLGVRQVLISTVPLRDGNTLYELTGNLLVNLLSILALLAAWLFTWDIFKRSGWTPPHPQK
ncbi:MAG: apolipoprotein N-acyltransferase [Actinobacteria bacterium]|nr:apolipoprotein N-acyltransferase [Actinomycetota bacterium]